MLPHYATERSFAGKARRRIAEKTGKRFEALIGAGFRGAGPELLTEIVDMCGAGVRSAEAFPANEARRPIIQADYCQRYSAVLRGLTLSIAIGMRWE